MEAGNLAQIASALLSLVTLTYVIISARSKASNDKVAKLEGVVEGRASKSVVEAIELRVREVERQQIEMESNLSHLPDREMAHRMEMAIARLEGRLETLDERLKPVAAIGDRLQEFLLEQARVKP